jgi:hypothetical protein
MLNSDVDQLVRPAVLDIATTERAHIGSLGTEVQQCACSRT